MVFNRACALQKSEAPKLYQFSPSESMFWIGEDLGFLIVDLTFHGQWQICFPRQPPRSGSFAFLRSHTGFAQSVEVVRARCDNWIPSCACYLAHLSWDLDSKGRFARIKNCGTATSYHGSKWSQELVIVHCRKVKTRCCTSFFRAIQVCVGEALLFWSLIWHFMASGILFRFDTSHHAVVVFLVLGATLVLPIQAGATVEVVKARCQNILPSCASHLAHLIHLSPDLYSKYDCARMTTVRQPTASRVLFGPIVAQIATPKAGAQHLQSCCRCISSGATKGLGHRKLFSTDDAA